MSNNIQQYLIPKKRKLNSHKNPNCIDTIIQQHTKQKWYQINHIPFKLNQTIPMKIKQNFKNLFSINYCFYCSEILNPTSKSKIIQKFQTHLHWIHIVKTILSKQFYENKQKKFSRNHQSHTPQKNWITSNKPNMHRLRHNP